MLELYERLEREHPEVGASLAGEQVMARHPLGQIASTGPTFARAVAGPRGPGAIDSLERVEPDSLPAAILGPKLARLRNCLEQLLAVA